MCPHSRSWLQSAAAPTANCPPPHYYRRYYLNNCTNLPASAVELDVNVFMPAGLPSANYKLSGRAQTGGQPLGW